MYTTTDTSELARVRVVRVFRRAMVKAAKNKTWSRHWTQLDQWPSLVLWLPRNNQLTWVALAVWRKDGFTLATTTLLPSWAGPAATRIIEWDFSTGLVSCYFTCEAFLTQDRIHNLGKEKPDIPGVSARLEGFQGRSGFPDFRFMLKRQFVKGCFQKPFA